MDTLNAYGSDDDDSSVDEQKQEQQQKQPPESRPVLDRRYLQAAPTVSITAGRDIVAASTTSTALATVAPKRKAAGALVLHNNPTKAVLYAPVQGPQAPDPSTEQRKSKAGRIETDVHIDRASFAEERLNFQRSGQAAGPTGERVVRTTLGYTQERLQQFAQAEETKRKRPRSEKKQPTFVQGSDDEAEFGVWGPPTAEERWNKNDSVTNLQKGDLHPAQLAERAYFAERDRQRGIDVDQDQTAQERLVERKMSHLLPSADSRHGPMEATTTFHGTQETNYKGQSWTAPPPGMGSILADGGASHHRCHVPKQCVSRVTGHTQGVHRIRLFPITGHLLLSAGLDGLCKVWSVAPKQNQLTCMRTYHGHSAAVRDVQFNKNGTQFVSASFDRYLRLWNTESGVVLQTFTSRKVPYVVQFFPHNDKYFVVGQSDNKIVTYHTESGKITQEYNHHLAPVNAICFVEDHGTKMVSSSDDKKVLVWEWDIGVPIKYISDPSMQALPCLALHPSHNFICGQSLDNTIVVFQAGKKFTMMRKKKFTGHIVSGYACEVAFSPDGACVMSGDGNGALFVWDFKRHKILQKYRAHSKGPAIGCVWHPLEPSTVFTCGWDGAIKMWK